MTESRVTAMGTVFKGIIGRAAEWPADAFDPSVLLSISTTAIQHNKANSRVRTSSIPPRPSCSLY